MDLQKIVRMAVFLALFAFLIMKEQLDEQKYFMKFVKLSKSLPTWYCL